MNIAAAPFNCIFQQFFRFDNGFNINGYVKPLWPQVANKKLHVRGRH